MSLALTACSGDSPAAEPEPSEPSDPTTSQTPTREPTDEPTEPEVQEPELPELPEAATRSGPKGAAAFVRFYVKLMDFAQSTGDIDLMLANANGCEGCANFADLFERTVEAGGFFKGAGWSVRVATAFPGERDTLDVLTVVDIAGGTYKESAGSPVENLDRKSYDLKVTVSRIDQRWQVDEFVQTQVGDT